MKQITLKVPESKYNFFIELLKNLEFVKISGEDIEITEEEKNIVRRRIKNTRPEDLKKWDDVSDTFKLS